MKVIKPKFEIIEQEPCLEGIYKAAELPGRICYHSQDRIAPGSAEKFCKGLMKSNHGAPLEHNGVYLVCSKNIGQKYEGNPYTKITIDQDYDVYYISTNLRVLFENDWMDDLQYISEPIEGKHEKRITVKFILDRFTGEEYLRHRKASFNRESTRYVNFTKDKFGGGNISFICPPWMKFNEGYELPDDFYERITSAVVYNNKWYNKVLFWLGLRSAMPLTDMEVWLWSLKSTEKAYDLLVSKFGWKAEEARTVLPCAINSPLIMTAFISDWKHFFNLRAIGTTGKPHPQAQELAEPLMIEFKKRGYIE